MGKTERLTPILTVPCFHPPPADLGEQFQPSGGDLREGDRERGREPVTERHAVQSGPAVHLHTDRQTGELMIGHGRGHGHVCVSIICPICMEH